MYSSMRFIRTVSYVTSYLVLTACSVGPRYEAPMPNAPEKWQSVSLSDQPNHRAWWRLFHDPTLNHLIEQSAVCNLSMQTARARVRAAQADYAVAFAQLFPKVNANLLPPDGTGTGLTQVLALTASLEPDLFGKQRQNRQRTEAIVQAEQAEHDFALLHLQAEIAAAYLEFREAQGRAAAFRHNLIASRQLLTLLRSKYQSGLTNYLPLAQQEALIAAQMSEIEQNQALMIAMMHKIEQLIGRNPGMLAKQLSQTHPIPQMQQSINLTTPSEILTRRPDIIAAERRVAAAHADIRVAIANLFPKISIGWLQAWQPQSLAGNFLAIQNSTSTFLGTFDAPLLNLTLYRMVDLKKREKALAVIQYHQAVMRALHEVETQYQYSQHYKKSANYLKQALEKKHVALDLSTDLYQKGAADFNTVLHAEEDLNQLEVSYLHQVVLYQVAQINLYTALGGGIPNSVKPVSKGCHTCRVNKQ